MQIVKKRVKKKEKKEIQDKQQIRETKINK